MSEPSFETLDEFKDWLISSEGPGLMGAMPTLGSVSFIEGATILTMYRRGCFQAELLCGRSGYRYKSSLSEKVERCAIFMGGGITVSADNWDGTVSEQGGLELLNAETDNPSEVPNPEHGLSLSLSEGTSVSFSFGENGGALLLVSKFLEGSAANASIEIDTERLSSSA